MRFFLKREPSPVRRGSSSGTGYSINNGGAPGNTSHTGAASNTHPLDPRKALAMALQGGASSGVKYSNGGLHNGLNGSDDAVTSNGTRQHYPEAANGLSVGLTNGSLRKKSDSKLAAFFSSSSSSSDADKKKKRKQEASSSSTASADSWTKMYHWQGEEVGGKKSSTADDMVLLSKISEAAITDNLRKRLMEDKIYTYIGPVLVAVNPFKTLSCFGEREVRLYQGAAQYEVPPHIYALADNMYRNMMIDHDSQCVIISGESGAGKTVSAKFIMHYMTQISGGGSRLQHVKDVILKSNPLLEAFGNAKTTKNNNSSRFGKYIEIQFSKGGEPLGGKVSNFLLEKSRVHYLTSMERNFHIFYQLCAGDKTPAMEVLGISEPDHYHFLNRSCVAVDGVDDKADFQETIDAMTVMGMSESHQIDVLRVVAAVLHLSNVFFEEHNNDAYVVDPAYLEYPAYLLGIPSDLLGNKLVSRVWGEQTDRVEMTFNKEKAQFARDAWAKGLYSRLFEYIVKVVNEAMATDAKDLNIGILDIYGFEIFNQNGFEQFCINYVNEKLQQIFIELTLKSEQEEYAAEGIAWKPIQFFNNAIVCELIENRRPVGVLSVLDDTCATMSAVTLGADQDFRRTMDSMFGDHHHYRPFKNGFTIKHYAGDVSYHVDGFCEKNRDVLNADIIEAMQSSDNAFIRSLFPELLSELSRGRPTTVGSKIKTQAKELVGTLMQCVPHYIRCIKPNETKKPKDWDQDRVKHQVEYLGLKENIKVKRAGFAYRRPFQKFLARYAILSRNTWPQWTGPPTQGIKLIMKEANMDDTHYQLGTTKVFIKDPESLYLLEECRERKFDHYARVIQKAFKQHFSKRRLLSEKEAAAVLVQGHKERRRFSIHRAMHGDYLGVPMNPGLLALLPKREKVLFALTVDKFDRQFRAQKRDLVVTSETLLMVGRAKCKQGPDKGRVVEVVKRRIPLGQIEQVALSKLQDDFLLIRVRDDYASLLQVRLKTELLLVLTRALQALGAPSLDILFSNSFQFTVRNTGWVGGGASKKVVFTVDGAQGEESTLSVSGAVLTVKTETGLPPESRPSSAPVDPYIRMLATNHNRHTKQQSSASRSQQKNNNNNTHVGSKQSSPSRVVNSRPSAAVAINNAQNNNKNRRTPRAAALLHTGGINGPVRSITSKISKTASHFNQPPPPKEPAPEDQPTIPTGFVRPSPPLKPLPPKPVTRPKVRAIYSYDARDIDELTFEAGDLLDLVKEDPTGWWTCSFGGKEGFCPGNYLEKL